MSSRLPVVSGKQLVRALEREGWQQVRQRGSHVRLKHLTDAGLSAEDLRRRGASAGRRPTR